MKDEERLAGAFWLVLSRSPRAEEAAVLLKQLAAQREEFRLNPASATKWLSIGELPRDKSLDPAELAAWTTVTSVLLNLHEVVTKR